MNSLSLLELLFWTCISLVAFAYLVYPLLIWVVARVFGRAAVPPHGADLPTVSVLIAAFNEELDIRARVENLLALDYPPDRLELVIASDGSTDRTNEIVRAFEGRGVTLIAFPENRGKAAVMNAVVPRLRGTVVVLSDANTHMAPDAVRHLAGWFADPSVGVVCGRLVLTDAAGGRNADGVYWRYETFLKKCESRLGALLGSNGAIYAVRRANFPLVPGGSLIDDFVIPLDAKRRSGCRIVYDARAVAEEETAPTVRAEFRRRVRIGAGGFQSIGMLWRLLSPANGWVAFTFLSHKVLRWACPFFMLGMLGSNALLLGAELASEQGAGLYAGLMAAQVGFYLLALAGNWLPARPRFLRVFRLPTMFVSMNAALFLGFFRWFSGRQGGTWKRTDRTPEGANPPVVEPVVLGR